MSRTIDVVLNAMDNMSPVVNDATEEVKDLEKAVQDTAENGSDSVKKLNLSFAEVTAGIAVAGAAVSAYAESQQELVSQSNRAAVSLGMERSEFVDLANEISNVTFPLDEAITLMELAGKQGLESSEDIAEFATFWDTLGDATGENSQALAEGAAGLRAMGIAAGEESEAINAYGTIIGNTSLDITKFNELLSRNAETAQAYGLTVDDMAVAYSYMQNELGMTAEMMESEFENVIVGSTDSLIAMQKELGLTDEWLEKATQEQAMKSVEAMREYGSTLDDSSSLVQDLADAHADSFSIWDKMKQKISEVSLAHSDQIQIAGNVGTIMTGLSSVMSIASTVQGLFATTTAASGVASVAATPGVVGFGAAVNAAIWPITLIVVAIGAVIFAVVQVVKHFDELKEVFSFVFDFMKDKAEGFSEGISETFNNITSFVGDVVEGIGNTWNSMTEGMKSGFLFTINAIINPFETFINSIISGINVVIDGLNFLGANIQNINEMDLSIGDSTITRNTTQTINVNTSTQLDGKEIARSTATTTRRIATTNAL